MPRGTRTRRDRTVGGDCRRATRASRRLSATHELVGGVSATSLTGWQRGHQYVERACRPSRPLRIGAPQRRQGRPACAHRPTAVPSGPWSPWSVRGPPAGVFATRSFLAHSTSVRQLCVVQRRDGCPGVVLGQEERFGLVDVADGRGPACWSRERHANLGVAQRTQPTGSVPISGCSLKRSRSEALDGGQGVGACAPRDFDGRSAEAHDDAVGRLEASCSPAKGPWLSPGFAGSI